MKSLYESILNSNGAEMIVLDDQSIQGVRDKLQSGEYTEKDIKRFNTSKVTNMYNLFLNCSSLEKLDLSKWNTSKVKGMDGMFNNCFSLKTIIMKNCNDKTVDMIKKQLKINKINAEIIR